jgi:acyl-CoA thioester hydrolase
MSDNNEIYSLEFTVRDYECDIQGVEHARHEFLISKGISFVKLHEEGIDLIVTKVEIDYKFPLRSRDKFKVSVDIRREGNVRLVFIQEIYRLPDEKHVVHAKVTGAATRKGRPVPPGNLLIQLGLA